MQFTTTNTGTQAGSNDERKYTLFLTATELLFLANMVADSVNRAGLPVHRTIPVSYTHLTLPTN